MIVIDDGLASGYTMMAAIESVRRRQPKRVIAAVPAASATAVKKVEKIADRVVTVVTALSISLDIWSARLIRTLSKAVYLILQLRSIQLKVFL